MPPTTLAGSEPWSLWVLCALVLLCQSVLVMGTLGLFALLSGGQISPESVYMNSSDYAHPRTVQGLP